MKDLRGLTLFKEVGITVELLRLEYRGNVAKAYLPRIVRDALRLDPERDKTLILVYDNDTEALLLVRDAALSAMLKPRILEARKVYAALKASISKDDTHGN
jgi:hypothetical protein